MPTALQAYLTRLDAAGEAYTLNAVLTDGGEACGGSLGVDALGFMIDGGAEALPRFIPWASVYWVAVETH